MNKLKLFLIITLLLLAGCDENISGTDILKAEQFCKDKKGIRYINLTGENHVICWQIEESIYAGEYLSHIQLKGH